MTSLNLPILPILTSRSRFYGAQGLYHPVITIRQRFHPYASPTRRRPLSGVNHRPTISPPDAEEPSPTTAQSITSGVLKPINQNDGLIPRPPGEPGRKVKGYNLEETLAWPEMETSNFKKLVHRLSNQHLDVTKCFLKQNTHATRVIADMAITEFPRLTQYRDAWPVEAVIKMYLKNTSARFREASGTRGPSRRKKGSK